MYVVIENNTHTHTHTHIHTQPFNGFWSVITRVGQYQKKHSLTHTHPDHRTSLINFLHLLRSIASSLFSLRTWQSFSTTSVQVLFGLPLGLEPSTSYYMHFFTQSSSSFHSTCPYHRSLFCCNTNVMPSIPNLSLSFSLTPHIRLCSLKCHHIFFSYRPGLISMQHTASHTTTVQPSSHNQWYVLIGKQWDQLPELIPTNSNSSLHNCISISIHTQLVT